MREIVRIVCKHEDGFYKVSKIRPSSCDSCGSANLCGVRKEFEFLAKNSIAENGDPLSREDFKPGQEVYIELSEIPISKISFIVYGFPTLFFVFSLVFFLSVLKLSETLSLLFSFLVLAVSFLGLAFYDRRVKRKKNLYPKIVGLKDKN